jgi:drug/metabolite transporter (DMT)-like permease
MGSFYISIIMLMRVVQSLCGKQTSMLMPKGVNPYIKYLTAYNLFAAAFSLISLLTGDITIPDIKTIAISSVSGMFLAAACILNIIAMKMSSMALNSMFATAGLLVPCIAGIFLFGEPMSIMQWIAIIPFFISAYLLIGASSKNVKFTPKTMLILIASLISNGMTMLMQKLFVYCVPGGNVSVFSLFTFAVPAAIGIIAVLAGSFLPHEKKPLDKKLFIFGAILAFAVFIINQFATLAASFISSAVLFTLINGGATIIAALVGAIVYQEKLTPRSIVGIAVGVASLICIKAFE